MPPIPGAASDSRPVTRRLAISSFGGGRPPVGGGRSFDRGGSGGGPTKRGGKDGLRVNREIRAP